MERHGGKLDVNFDLSTLSYISEGYSSGTIDQVLLKPNSVTSYHLKYLHIFFLGVNITYPFLRIYSLQSGNSGFLGVEMNSLEDFGSDPKDSQNTVGVCQRFAKPVNIISYQN